MLIHSVFIAVPVTIMPVTARDDSNILPQYEAALRNPGTILMRSNTLPPAYDALHPTPRGQNVAADQEQPGDTHSDASSDVPPLSLVEPGTEVNGFPAPLRRSRSQFYLASPDSTPPMRPVDSTTILVDMPESSNMASRGSNQRSRLSAMMADPDQHFDTLPLPLPPFLYGQNGRTQSNAQDTQSDCEHSLCRTESRASTTSSRRLSSLGDRLNNITDKMRSIFHGRSSASGDIRRYSNAS
ncbi:hypothetical protein H4S02_013021, partial [Coemansia sp. RSA 2611]